MDSAPTPMDEPELHAEGLNYRIVMSSGIATCEVRVRSDISSDAGAACAEEKIRHFRTLASRASVRAMVFDLEHAPPVTGPRTQKAIGQLLEPFETNGKPIVVVIGPSPTQQMQLRRLIDSHAPMYGVLVKDRDSARKQLEGSSRDHT